MLILTRGENEAIRIGDDIKIIVSSIRENRVRIGIDAPEGIVILRQEVHEKNQARNHAE